MAFVKIWVHAVWGTKNRAPFLQDKEIRLAVFDHIKENAKKKSIYLDNINGWVDHCHVTFAMPLDISIKKVIQLLKGESTHWINKEKMLPFHFSWAEGYYAISVSESNMPKVRAYISNQENHHRKISFKDECEKFIQQYGFEKFLTE